MWPRSNTIVVAFFSFCKQKTAYEMRISDGSSDVCSSDLFEQPGRYGKAGGQARGGDHRIGVGDMDQLVDPRHQKDDGDEQAADEDGDHGHGGRSEERRVGKEWVSTCSSRWAPSA